MHFLPVWFLSMVILLCGITSANAIEQIHIAVIQGNAPTPLQESLEGFQDFFKETPQGIKYSFHTLQPDGSNSQKILTLIEHDKPQIVLSLGSLPLQVVCPELGRDIIVIGVSLRQRDFRCDREIGGVYLEYPSEVQLDWMRRILPQARNVGVIYSTRLNKIKVADASSMAQKLGMTIIQREVAEPYQIPAALSDLSNRADVLWGISDKIVLTPGTVRKMLLFSFRNKVPFVGLSKAWGRAGALYALDRDYRDIGRQCAEMAFEEYKKTEGYTLMPQPPRLVRYYLNLKTAQLLNIDLSSSLIQGAEETY